ncbi:hypothetical protein ACLB2K_053587 [Fragaria x ananassa]
MQAVAGISHISFGEEEGVTPKKPTTIAEVAKLRELSGTLETEAEAEARLKKQLSESKYKELSGHDIFAPPPEILPRETTAPRQLALKGSIQIGEPTSPVYESAKSTGGQINVIPGEDPVSKTAKKIYEKKFSELSGNDIFKGDVPPSSAEKPLSVAKLREMSGSNIFADGKAEAREYLGVISARVGSKKTLRKTGAGGVIPICRHKTRVEGKANSWLPIMLLLKTDQFRRIRISATCNLTRYDLVLQD